MASLFGIVTASLLVFFSQTATAHPGAALQRRAVPTNLPGTWTYSGCYTDAVGSRTLSGAGTYSGTAMSASACISFCSSRGFPFAGTEYSAECFCGSQVAAGATLRPDTECNMACSGAPGESCGGPNRLSVYNSGQTTPSGPVTNPGPPGWISRGCYTDTIALRTLPTFMPTPGGVGAATVALCTSACYGSNFVLAGVEYGGECFCANAISNGGQSASSGCDMPCNGNSTELCGGPNRLNVYERDGSSALPSSSSAAPVPTSTAATTSAAASAPASWQALGCYTDSVAARTLSTPVFPAGGLTIEKCVSACQAAGFILAGVEYGGECFCDNVFRNGGGPAPDGNAQCNMACTGNPAQICGGPNRLNVYRYGADGTATTSATSAAGTTAVVTATTSSSTGTATGLPVNWQYIGCYVDGAQGRIMRTQLPDSATLTIESCINSCVSAGFAVAGLQYSSQCFCDDFIVNDGALAASEDECGMPCSGNAAQDCGGPNRMSVYSDGPLEAFEEPGPQTGGLVGSWEYQGCLTDDAVARTFPYQLILDDNTANNCLSACSKFGYGAGGMEFGNECYCGDFVNVAAAGATIRPEAECNVVCPGNSTSICGAGNRITYYLWTGEPLNRWDFRTGPAAGEYRFLIGGPVIPLISTPAVNGKVTFIEKYGTGPPNSTGAYELDVTQIDDFSKAWRTMSVKTDVFCAAGLTLPDKVGTQITVGGWANEATYGVRLYWPDGSPGVPGVNDWQENVNVLSLQVGRWYPTPMIMANGSILVVGGQEGANGAPVPSLEILPRPAGGHVLLCDYLQRTDPYNLYPYLAVLPSGGIFIAYYNEARILDPVTFDTIKVLPNIPAAVNNPLGGRTYPFEGTMMVLPQKAPYTDPLGMIICGGSTPGPEIALDNCVTIYPDAPEPTWTIERMPYKRVIPMMTALPDGTYLILGGAMAGRAGFGTASIPCNTAVLYDPSKPVNQRMSVMANTTIDRMYHSEAVLIPDGRVLVSGSDPQDPRYAQEYRVEVFMPPYLLSGLPRPTFTITNKDWVYGQSVQFTVTAGSTANLRVSLMGAESSTHGNTMGQRTIFPAVSCAGNTCTLVAPPNANVAPPGWFQMFVLDGPTPSVSVWVRCGGDPASLGNWPSSPDFKRPGL